MNKQIISEKFKNISVDNDTKILSRKEVKIQDYDVIHEIWVWQGIHAESFIFFNEDINDLKEDEVLNLVGEKEVTYKKSDEYTFVNFNFTTPY